MNDELRQLREEIKHIDKGIIKNLASRFEVVKKIGELKNKNGGAVEDKIREKELFDFYQQISQAYGVDLDLVRKIFTLVIDQSKKIQK